MFVASVVIGYALKLLEYHGLVDGPDPPMPANSAADTTLMPGMLKRRM
jgi:hypothetical protein